jgi:hypothetical protein
MPNIENLKKQAKQYLRWHRDRYNPVAAIIRSTLPRFRDLGDVQILQSSFKLADAQALVARQEGFDHWQALIQGAETMSSTPTQSPSSPAFSSIEAQILSLMFRPHATSTLTNSASKWSLSMAIRPSTGKSAAVEDILPEIA